MLSAVKKIKQDYNIKGNGGEGNGIIFNRIVEEAISEEATFKLRLV